MKNNADYDAWLRSPFGQVHVQAEQAAKQRQIIEAQAIIAHFDAHPKLAEGVSVASRCASGWWDRERCGSVHEIIEYGFTKNMQMHLSAWQQWMHFVTHSNHYEYKNDRWRKRRPKKMRKIA